MSYDLDEEIKGAQYTLFKRIREVESRLDSLKDAVKRDRVLNDLGALQQLGPQLDVAVAVLATLKRLKDQS